MYIIFEFKKCNFNNKILHLYIQFIIRRLLNPKRTTNIYRKPGHYLCFSFFFLRECGLNDHYLKYLILIFYLFLYFLYSTIEQDQVMSTVDYHIVPNVLCIVTFVNLTFVPKQAFKSKVQITYSRPFVCTCVKLVNEMSSTCTSVL